MFDRTNPTQLAAMVSELTLDPVAVGYADPVSRGATAELAGLLAAADPAGAVHAVASFNGEDLLASLTASAAEYNAVIDGFATAAQVPARKLFIGRMLDYGATPIPKRFHATLGQIFSLAGAPTIRAAILAELNGPMSRAEALFGDDTVVTRQDMQAVLAAMA